MQFRIDASGNMIVSPDTAATSAKLVALYLVTALVAGGNEVTYDSDSVISDVRYDFTTHELSWLEQGQNGRQTVIVDNSSLRAALGLLHTHSIQPTASEIATAVSQSLDLSNLATLQAVDEAKQAVIGALPSSPDITGLATSEQLDVILSKIVDSAVYAVNESVHSSNELEILESVRDLRGQYCKTSSMKKEN